MNLDAKPSEPRSGSRAGRYARTTAGWTLLAAGTALLVLPGPGIPIMLGGLALLARDQPWAHRTRRWLEARFARLRRRVRE